MSRFSDTEIKCKVDLLRIEETLHQRETGYVEQGGILDLEKQITSLRRELLSALKEMQSMTQTLMKPNTMPQIKVNMKGTQYE